MPNWFRRTREVATRKPETRVVDPELGPMKYVDSWWECAVSSKSGPVTLCVGGGYEPDPACIESARATARRIDEFVDDVKTYLKAEAQQRALRPFAHEIDALTISDVHYVWPKKPRYGMVYFSGPDKIKVWHCDIKEQTLFGLTFDS